MQNADVYLPEYFHRYPTTEDNGRNYTHHRIERAENVVRKDKIWYPENTGAYSTRGNKMVRFELPDLGCYDFKRSALYMTITIQQTPAAVDPYVRLPNFAALIFDRFRHLDGAQPVEDRNDANRIQSMLWLYQNDPLVVDKIGNDLLGFGTPEERNAKGLVATKYAIPIPLNFLTAGIMPLRKFGQQFVELYLADPNTYLETNGTDNVVTLSEIEWHFAQVEGKAFCDALEADVDAGRFQVAIDGWQLFQNSNLTIQNNLVISHRARAFKGVHTRFRQGNDLNNPLAPYQRFWTSPKLECADYQYRILGDLWPELPVDCRGDAQRNYVDYVKWTNSWFANGHSKDAPNVGIREFNDEAFMVMGDFTNDPHILEKSYVVNNISTSRMATDLQLNVRFNVSPPAGYVADHYIHYTIMVFCPAKAPFRIDY